MYYKKLYLKYKKKYLLAKENLKKQIGSSEKVSDNPYGRLFFNYSIFNYDNVFMNDLNKNVYDTENMLEYGDAVFFSSERENDENNFDENYIKWNVWKNIFDKTQVIFEDQQEEYEDDKFKLFRAEVFLESEFLQELIEKYQIEYNQTRWTDENLPDFRKECSQNNFSFIQKISLPSDSKICIIGDIHSSLHSFLRILFEIKDDYFESTSDMILKDNRYIIFLGDIVDRGPYSMELLVLIFGLKFNNFDKVFIINGNHEEYPTYMTIYKKKNLSIQRFGLELEYDEQHEDPDNADYILYSMINEVLSMLPSCIYLKVNDKYYHFSHGGFEPEFSGISTEKINDEDLETSKKPKILENELQKFLTSDKNFHLLKMWGHFVQYSNNYKWADFDNTVDWAEINYHRGGRNTKYLKLGKNITKKYIESNNIVSLITGHQDTRPISFLIKSPDNIRFIESDNYNLSTLDFEFEDLKLQLNEKKEEYNEIITKSKFNEKDLDRLEVIKNEINIICLKNIRVEIDPTEFLALTTSTATISRFTRNKEKINDKVYLELII